VVASLLQVWYENSRDYCFSSQGHCCWQNIKQSFSATVPQNAKAHQKEILCNMTPVPQNGSITTNFRLGRPRSDSQSDELAEFGLSRPTRIAFGTDAVAKRCKAAMS